MPRVSARVALRQQADSLSSQDEMENLEEEEEVGEEEEEVDAETGQLEKQEQSKKQGLSTTPHSTASNKQLKEKQQSISRGGRQPGSRNFSTEEKTALLDIIEEILPVTLESWDEVEREYKAWCMETGSLFRFSEALKRKFSQLVGNSQNNKELSNTTYVRRARLIRNKMVAKTTGLNANYSLDTHSKTVHNKGGEEARGTESEIENADEGQRKKSSASAQKKRRSDVKATSSPRPFRSSTRRTASASSSLAGPAARELPATAEREGEEDVNNKPTSKAPLKRGTPFTDHRSHSNVPHLHNKRAYGNTPSSPTEPSIWANWRRGMEDDTTFRHFQHRRNDSIEPERASEYFARLEEKLETFLRDQKRELTAFFTQQQQQLSAMQQIQQMMLMQMMSMISSISSNGARLSTMAFQASSAAGAHPDGSAEGTTSAPTADTSTTAAGPALNMPMPLFAPFAPFAPFFSHSQNPTSSSASAPSGAASHGSALGKRATSADLSDQSGGKKLHAPEERNV